MAEAHPVGFRWVMKAKQRGARVIHVDPGYGRTSQLADMYVPIRAGTDVAFLGGLIRHVIETGSYFKEYVVNYTNACAIVDESFRDTEDLHRGHDSHRIQRRRHGADLSTRERPDSTQALISLVTIGLIISRAVGILS
jgi:anaerobic selenocysteine-containing dehydrogenase